MGQKTNNWVVSLLLFACFVMYVIIELRPSRSDADDNTKSQLEQLQKENDSLKNRNVALDKEFKRLQKKADKLQQIVILASDSIKLLKQKKYEKVNRIDQFRNDELFDFFAGYKTQGAADR
jgi:uncharacterized protein YlxW (UPF0749 family)